LCKNIKKNLSIALLIFLTFYFHRLPVYLIAPNKFNDKLEFINLKKKLIFKHFLILFICIIKNTHFSVSLKSPKKIKIYISKLVSKFVVVFIKIKI